MNVKVKTESYPDGNDLYTIVGYNDEYEVSTEELERYVIASIVPCVCTHCGAHYGNAEPDARGYHCSECDKDAVSSLLEIILF